MQIGPAKPAFGSAGRDGYRRRRESDGSRDRRCGGRGKAGRELQQSRRFSDRRERGAHDGGGGRGGGENPDRPEKSETSGNPDESWYTGDEEKTVPPRGPLPPNTTYLAGDRFGGSGQLDNLVSQYWLVNLSSYRKLENDWKRAIQDGKNVDVNVRVEYNGSDLRPSAFSIEYTIDGETVTKYITNDFLGGLS